MNLKKNWAFSLVALVSLGFNTACTDEEVALGTGLAIGGVAGYAAADRHDGRRDRCYVRTQCHEYRDYYGRRQRECRNERVCRNGRRRYDLNASSNQNALSSVAIGKNFGMSYAGADTLIYALEQSAYKKNHAPIQAMGLTSYDAGRLAQKKLPSHAGIKKLAKAVNQDPAYTKSMVKLVVEAM